MSNSVKGHFTPEEVATLRARFAAAAKGRPKRELAKQVDVSHVTLYAFIGGKPASEETLGKVQAFLDRPQPKPQPEYWAGVMFAAEAMSETVARLLKDARLATQQGTVGKRVTANDDVKSKLEAAVKRATTRASRQNQTQGRRSAGQ